MLTDVVVSGLAGLYYMPRITVCGENSLVHTALLSYRTGAQQVREVLLMSYGTTELRTSTGLALKAW